MIWRDEDDASAGCDAAACDSMWSARQEAARVRKVWNFLVRDSRSK